MYKEISYKEFIVRGSTMDDTGYILHHLGEKDLPYNAVSPPIFQTSIFSFKSFKEFQRAIGKEDKHYLYTRGNNPTVNVVETKIAALEHAERSKLVSSGVAAIAAATMAFLKTGDHVVCVEDSYSWTKRLFGDYLKRFGVECTFVEGVDPGDFEMALRSNTKLFYLESPTTFTFKVQDVEEIVKIARTNNVKTVMDNTWASPFFFKPIELGVDIVVHSASKYLGGNSDLVAGVVSGKNEDMEHIFNTEFLQLGYVPDPFMAWLILRGLRTLHIRMPIHFENALYIANFLENHPKVESVLYPFLSSHPQYKLIKRQMKGGAGLFSFRLKSDRVGDVERFVNNLTLFKLAVSWGGYESLVFPEAVRLGEEERDDIDVSLIRIHVGLEDKEALREDLDRALGLI